MLASIEAEITRRLQELRAMKTEQALTLARNMQTAYDALEPELFAIATETDWEMFQSRIRVVMLTTSMLDACENLRRMYLEEASKTQGEGQ